MLTLEAQLYQHNRDDRVNLKEDHNFIIYNIVGIVKTGYVQDKKKENYYEIFISKYPVRPVDTNPRAPNVYVIKVKSLLCSYIDFPEGTLYVYKEGVYKAVENLFKIELAEKKRKLLELKKEIELLEKKL